MEKVVIIDALRTPVGRFLGRLSSLSAPQLCSIVIEGIIKRQGVKPSKVDEVIMGNVLSAGIGQNPARQAALLAGLPESLSAFTVNKVCASGLKAVALGAQVIALGEADCVIAGGMESMSNAPFILREMRRGRRYGDSQVVDTMLYDGLWDYFYDAHMGTLCELTVKKYKITREEQDAFAYQSHRKAMEATKAGFFKEEIVPVTVREQGGEVAVDVDETLRLDTSPMKLSLLKPVFVEGGTITAGNAPGLNDGAAALLLMSERRAKRLKVKPLAEVVGYTSAYHDPKWYTTAPIKSVRRLLKETGLELDNFDLIEENEAFAAQTIAVIKELNLNPLRVNCHGGAIALGHPIGASGARILVTLVHALRQRGERLGLATICLGGGGAMSMAVRVA